MDLGFIVGGMIKNKLQSMGINTDGVNFNDMNSINQFAQKILPGMIKSNPQMKDFIKQNIGNLDKAQQDEVVKVIDSM